MGKEKLTKKQKKLQAHKEDKLKRKGLSEVEIAEEKKAKVEKRLEKKEAKKQAEDKKQKNKRNILFIGNLSYNTSEDKLKEHFKACEPTFRMRKGFAFAEFNGADATKRLNVAIRMHHTILDGRKINVELTAGGGGNSKARHAKLKERNEKLNEEREERRKQEDEDAAKKKKEKERDIKKPKKPEAKQEAGPTVHPSRLKMMS